jgi:pyruvate kinase
MEERQCRGRRLFWYESAAGKYPVEAVQALTEIIKETEQQGSHSLTAGQHTETKPKEQYFWEPEKSVVGGKKGQKLFVA